MHQGPTRKPTKCETAGRMWRCPPSSRSVAILAAAANRQRRLQSPDVGGRRRGGGAFDGAVARDHVMAEPGQMGAATAGAAHLLFYQRIPEDAVDLVDEQPGAPVRHVHFLAGC